MTQILRFLIPAEMLAGNYPTDEFLESHNLAAEYKAIGHAVRGGDIAHLEELLDKNCQIYIQSGVFLALEKLRFQAQRNLFKRIAIAIQQNPAALTLPEL